MNVLTLPMTLKELELLDLIMSGEAARICNVDRRTFMRRVEIGEIKPVANVEGRQLFEREHVIRLAKKFKAEKDESKR